MQRYHALEALRMTRSRGILQTSIHRSNHSRSRGSGSQDLRSYPSFPSEADSLQSHPPNTTLGSNSSSFSEQSSIQTDDDDSSLEDYSLYSSTPTRMVSHSVSNASRRTPLTLIQELSFSIDLDDGSAENNHPSANQAESPHSSSDCKPSSFPMVGSFLGVGGAFRLGTRRRRRLGLFDDNVIPSPPRTTELREASIRAIHNRSVKMDSPKTVHRRNFFGRRPPPPPPTIVASKGAGGRTGPLNDASSHNRNIPSL